MPTATTQSPTCAALLSPNVTYGNGLSALILSTRDIGARVAADDVRGVFAVVLQDDLDLRGLADHVVVGHDDAGRVDDEAGAERDPLDAALLARIVREVARHRLGRCRRAGRRSAAETRRTASRGRLPAADPRRRRRRPFPSPRCSPPRAAPASPAAQSSASAASPRARLRAPARPQPAGSRPTPAAAARASRRGAKPSAAARAFLNEGRRRESAGSCVIDHLLLAAINPKDAHQELTGRFQAN